MPTVYKRSFEELEAVASKFWPTELSEIESKLSVIPILLETQDQFINIINVETPSLENLFVIIEASSMSSNLFLKHLILLADFSGEMLKRVSREFNIIFPTGELHYCWRGKKRTYKFCAIPGKNFSNNSLKIDGKKLLSKDRLDDLQKDAIAMLLFGSTYIGDNQEVASLLAKCEIGEYLGKADAIATFVKQRYIWVSRITGGAKTNNLGQIAQKFVADYINEKLNSQNIKVKIGGRLPNVTHTDSNTKRMTSFDILVTDDKKFVAIEVGFQVTTNSVIERKAGQARARYEQIEKAGHKIAYVIDGSGNFERETALRIICRHSHCTVAFSRSELDLLCQFLSEQF